LWDEQEIERVEKIMRKNNEMSRKWNEQEME
jgi:hypothetical protein